MTQEHPELPPAGWHPDPAGSDQERYWDGVSWTEQLRAAETETEQDAPRADTGVIPDSLTTPITPLSPAAGIPPAPPAAPLGAPAQTAYQFPSAAPLPGTPMAHAPQGVPGEAGFFRSLFDLSFAPERVVTIKFSRVLYLIATIFSILGWIFGVIALFVIGSMMSYDGAIFTIWGVLHLLFGWIIPLLTIVVYRVGLEVMIAIIRTSQHTAQLAHQGARAEAFPRAQ